VARSKALGSNVGISNTEAKDSIGSFLSNTKDTGLEGEAGVSVMEGLSKYGAVKGISKDRMKLSSVAVFQMAGIGQLMAEEVFGQLSESLPGAATELAAANGMTVQQLRAMMKKGGGSSDRMLSKFGMRMNAIGDSNQSEMDNNPQTAVNRMSAATDNLQVKLGQSFLPLVSNVNIITNGIKLITDNFDSLAKVGSAAFVVLAARAVTATGIFKTMQASISGASLQSSLGMIGNSLTAIGKAAFMPIAQIAALSLAMEALQGIWSDMNGGDTPLKKLADDARDAAASLDKLKPKMVTPKDLGERLDSNYGEKNFTDGVANLFMAGDKWLSQFTGINKDFYKKNWNNEGSFTANKKANQDATRASEIIEQSDKVIASTTYDEVQLNKDNAKRRELEKKYRLLRLDLQNPEIRNNETKYQKKQKEISKVIADSNKLDEDPTKKQLALEKQIASVTGAIDQLQKIADPKNNDTLVFLNNQLLELQKNSANTAAGLGAMTKESMALSKAISMSIASVEIGKSAIERNFTDASISMLDQTSGSLKTGERSSNQYELDFAKLYAQKAVTQKNVDFQQGKISGEFADEIERYRKAGKITTEYLSDITAAQLQAMEADKDVNKDILASIKSYKQGSLDLQGYTKEQAVSRDNRRRALNEEFKASKEYYENAVMSSQEMHTTLSAQASELKKQTYTTKLRSGLVGFSSAMSQYTVGMIDIITELGKITTAEYEKTKKEQELAKQRLEAERANTAKNNAASVATEDTHNPSNTTNSSSVDKLIAPIKGQTVEVFANYKPKSPEGFYDKRKRKTGIENHEATDFAARAGGGEDAEVVAMMGGKATRLTAGPAWMGDMVKITNGNKVLNQIHMKPGSMNPKLKMGETIDIKQGEYLGKVANLGGKAENHIHIDLSIDGKKVIVEDYLKKQLTTSTSTSTSASASASTSSIKNKVIVSRTGEQDDKGLEKLKVETYDAQGKVISSLIANSGDPTKQKFSDSGQSASGTREPFEYGSYSIGKAAKGFDPSKVGKTFLPINPKFNTKRTNLGIHVDADRAIQAGSAGCLVFGTPAQLAEFQKSIANGQVDELQFVKSIKTLAGSNAKTNAKSKSNTNTNAKSKSNTNTKSTSNYTTVKATAYFPGKGDPSMEGGEVDIKDKKITENSLVMATRTTDTKGGIPYGTKAEIRNPKTGKTAIVSVVDRGPLAPGRDVDLTGGALKAIGMVPDGINDVQMRVINKEGSFDLGMSANGDKEFYKRVGNGGKIVNGSGSTNSNTKTTNASTKVANIDNTETNALSTASAENNAKAYKSQMDSFDEQQKAIQKTYTANVELIKITAITKENEVKRNLIKANRTKAEQELKTKRDSEDKNRSIGYRNTPEDARRYALIDSARKNDDEAMQYKNRIEDGKLELAENKKIIKQLEVNVKNPLKLTTEERKNANKILKTLPGLIKAQEKNIKQANDRLYEISKQTAKNKADIDMKFAFEQKDMYGTSNREVDQSQIDLKKTKLENIKSFQKTNLFDNSQGDPTAVEREIGLMSNKIKFDNAKQQIEKQLREGSKDPKIQADLKSRLAILATTLQEENAATNVKFAEQTQEIDAAKAKHLFDRMSLVAQTTRALNSSQGALRSAMGNTYQAKLYSIQDEKANLGDSLQTELFGISEERKKATTKKQMEELNIREANIRATTTNKISTIDTSFNRENDNKMFNYDRQIDSSNIDLMSTKSINLSKRGNYYDASTQEHEIAKSRLELEYVNKMKELDDQLLAADGDNYATDRINQLRDSFMLLNDVKLDAIEEEFSRFKGVMDETVKASDNIIGKIVGGMGTSGDDWLALLRAPFKGITDEITKFLSSTMNDAIHDGLNGMTGYLSKAMGGESSESVSARAKGNNSGFGGLMSTIGRWFGMGGGSPDNLAIGTDFLGSISGLLPFADGGVINPHKAQGAGDTTMVRVNNGEAVMVPEFVKMMGGAHGINKLNRNARGYADGGVIGSPSAPLGAAIAAPEASRPLAIEYTKIGERDYVDREHLDNMLQNQQKQSESRLKEYDRQTQDRMRYSQQYRSSVGLR
jgi:rare lipoprotein A